MESVLKSGKLGRAKRNSLYLFQKCWIRKNKAGLYGWISQEIDEDSLFTLEQLEREDHVFLSKFNNLSIFDDKDVVNVVSKTKEFFHIIQGRVIMDFTQHNPYYIISNGIYVNEEEFQINVTAYIQPDLHCFIVSDHTSVYKVDYSDVYITTDYNKVNDFVFSLTFEPFDSFLRYEEFHNKKDILSFSFAIGEINTLYSKEFKRLIKESKALSFSFKELNLQEKLVITCTDGELYFYPVLIPIFSNLHNSLFNRTRFRNDSIKLDYTQEFVKPLLVCYLDSELPGPDSIIYNEYFSNDIITIYAIISDYIGFDFFKRYFFSLSSRAEYKKLL